MDAFIARQPVFSAEQRVWAYELLFRHGTEKWLQGLDAIQAGSQVLANDAGFFDLPSLTGDRPAFVKFTRKLLLDRTHRLLHPEQIVVVVSEDVSPDSDTVEAIKRIKRDGYRIALDNIKSPADHAGFQLLTDIVKIDMLAAGPGGAETIIRELRRPRLRFLAGQVETWAVYRDAEDLGCHYFQGQYFQKPETLTHRDIPHNKHVALRLMQAVRQAQLNYPRLEALIKEDLALSYRLLRLVNSSWAGLPREILSVGHAMVMLGEIRVRQLVQMTALGHMGADSNEELIQRSFVRARFLETLAEPLAMGLRDQELYFIGLFSFLDTLLGKSMATVLELLPVSDEAQQALVERQGALAPLLLCAEALEEGDWENLDRLCGMLGLEAANVSELYIQALRTIHHMHTAQEQMS